MKYVDRLLQETEYLQLLETLECFEQDRIFCRHNLTHLLDTARIAWIRCLEQKLEMEKEQLYLAALLHDLGRIWEYEKGIPHEKASVVLAEQLLVEIQYPKERSAVILDAIGTHRSSSMTKKSDGMPEGSDISEGSDILEGSDISERGRDGEQGEDTLRALLKWADKKSRNCFFCKAQGACKWPEERRNQTVMY